MSALDYWGNDWATCEAKTSDFITPPDGKYEIEVESVDYDEVDDKRGGCFPQFTWVFRIIKGELTDSKFRKYTAIRQQSKLGFLKGEMQRLCIPTGCPINQLPNYLRMAVGSMVEVQVKSSSKVKQNGEPYKECYIQRLLKKSEWIVSGQIPPAPQVQQPQYPQQAQQQYRQQPQYPQNNGWNDNVSRYDAPYYNTQNDDIPF